MAQHDWAGAGTALEAGDPHEAGPLTGALLATRAELMLETGRPADAAADATRALEILQRTPRPTRAASFKFRALWALGRAQLQLGERDAALTTLHKARGLSERMHNPARSAQRAALRATLEDGMSNASAMSTLGA